MQEILISSFPAYSVWDIANFLAVQKPNKFLAITFLASLSFDNTSSGSISRTSATRSSGNAMQIKALLF
jgi:hypothetical protein